MSDDPADEGLDDSTEENGSPSTDRSWERAAPAWPVHDTEVVWETPFFEAGYDVVERPSGERANYYWLEPGDAAVVIPVTGDDEVVLVEQYRPRLRRDALGLPGGLVDDGEAPAAAAARELREETGYRAGELTSVADYVPTPWTRYVRHVFVARDLEHGEPDLDEGEYIDVERVPVSAALDRLRDAGDPTNGVAVTPLLLAREEGLL